MTIPKEITDKYGLTEYEETTEWLTNFRDATEHYMTDEELANENSELSKYRNEAYDTILELEAKSTQDLIDQLQLVTDALLEMADTVYE